MATGLRAVTVALLVTACATPQTDGLRANRGTLPESAEVADVAFFEQRTRESAPVALAMSLQWSGVELGPNDLVANVNAPGREGSVNAGLEATSRRHGRLAYPLKDLRALFVEVSAGRPVIVLLNLGLPWYPQRHYAVLIGYDTMRGTITLHSGATPRRMMPMETFERTWARGGFWALLILPPGDLPAIPDLDSYLDAVSALEQAGEFEAARRAYAAAVDGWPRSLEARMGLGNTLYALGRLEEANAVFRQATREHPRAADAYNGLAQALLGLGRLRRAEIAARRAVALDGRHQGIYRQTLDLILSLQRSGSSATGSATGNASQEIW